jgi:hypothetical protein
LRQVGHCGHFTSPRWRAFFVRADESVRLRRPAGDALLN